MLHYKPDKPPYTEQPQNDNTESTNQLSDCSSEDADTHGVAKNRKLYRAKKMWIASNWTVIKLCTQNLVNNGVIVSQMIRCDSDSCSIQWFHLSLFALDTGSSALGEMVLS